MSNFYPKHARKWEVFKRANLEGNQLGVGGFSLCKKGSRQTIIHAIDHQWSSFTDTHCKHRSQQSFKVATNSPRHHQPNGMSEVYTTEPYTGRTNNSLTNQTLAKTENIIQQTLCQDRSFCKNFKTQKRYYTIKKKSPDNRPQKLKTKSLCSLAQLLKITNTIQASPKPSVGSIRPQKRLDRSIIVQFANNFLKLQINPKRVQRNDLLIRKSLSNNQIMTVKEIRLKQQKASRWQHLREFQKRSVCYATRMALKSAKFNKCELTPWQFDTETHERYDK